MASQHIVFTFAGQGFPPVEAARDLYRTSQVFKQAVNEVENVMEHLIREGAIPDRTSIPLTQYFEEDEIRPPYATSFDQASNNTSHLTPPSETLVIVTAQYALSKVLKSWGITPQSVMAYSLGEVAAGASTGSFTLPAFLKLLTRRDALLGDRTLIPKKGGFALIFADGSTVKRVLAQEGMLGTIDIAGFLTPSGTGVAGEAEHIDNALEVFSRADIGTKRVKLDIGMHSHHVQNIADMIRSNPKIFPEADSKDCKIVPGIDHWSSLGFQMPSGSPLNANHYATLIRRPHRYLDSVRGIVRKHMTERPDQELIFLDMGMGPGQLYKFIRTTLEDTPEWKCGLLKGIPSIDPISIGEKEKSTIGWAERQLKTNLSQYGVRVGGSARHGPMIHDQRVQQQQQQRFTHTYTARTWQRHTQAGGLYRSAYPWSRALSSSGLNIRFCRRALFRL